MFIEHALRSFLKTKEASWSTRLSDPNSIFTEIASQGVDERPFIRIELDDWDGAWHSGGTHTFKTVQIRLFVEGTNRNEARTIADQIIDDLDGFQGLMDTVEVRRTFVTNVTDKQSGAGKSDPTRKLASGEQKALPGIIVDLEITFIRP